MITKRIIPRGEGGVLWGHALIPMSRVSCGARGSGTWAGRRRKKKNERKEDKMKDTPTPIHAASV